MSRIKPTSVLELEKGKLYSDQRDRAALEPKPTKDMIPRCPSRFSREERKAWKDIAAVLKNYGLFTAANSLQLELLATAWVQYLDCCRQMADSGQIIIQGPQGGAMYNPYFNAQHKLGALVDKYSQNLGLSSLGLAKIGTLMLKSKKKSEMEELLD
ncbi:MAG: Phage terminase, small subunit [Syntrophus sp. PtaU1.Bin005]|nr:MAG: Phage terminase, small subunit [Syntrophus sp. PtaU1.Bin005]